MSSSKPKTRGLAELLRLEKERREREEAENEDPSLDTSDGEAAQLTPAAEHLTPPANIPADSSPEELDNSSRAISLGQEVKLPSGDLSQGEVLGGETVEPAGIKSSNAPSEARSPKSDASLPRPRPPTVRSIRPRREKSLRPQLTNDQSDSGWVKFVEEWKPFLHGGVKFKMCEFFYQNTAAQGKESFITSSAVLSRMIGAHRRHIFLVLNQLENLRFIRKESISTNRKDEGLIIYFYPDRQA